MHRVAYAIMWCLSVCLSVTFVDCVETNISSKIFQHWVAKPFWCLHTKAYGNIPTGTPVTWVLNAGGG